jgi:uncharacterized protein YuzE
MRYFGREDVLHILVSRGKEAGSVEMAPNITVELNGSGDVIGMEILGASTYLRDTVMNTARAQDLKTRVHKGRKVHAVAGTR